MTKKEKNGKKEKKGISLKLVGWFITIMAAVVSAALVLTLVSLSETYNKVTSSTAEYMVWKETAGDLKASSDELTEQVRAYVVTGEMKYMDGYFTEVEKGRRQKTVEIAKEYLKDTSVYVDLQQALDVSVDLMNEEYYAMRLVVDYTGVSIDTVKYEEVKNVVLSDEDKNLSIEEKKELAKDKVFGVEYANAKSIITIDVNEAVSTLDKLLEKSVLDSSKQMKNIIGLQTGFIIVNILFFAAALLLMYIYLIKPIRTAIGHLINGENVEVKGVEEYRYIAQTYNQMNEQNARIKEKLEYEAHHDKLTGLENRLAYDSLFSTVSLTDSLFVLVDVDKFKEVNDQYGHASGDRVLKRVGATLINHFGGENAHVYRIGGDEYTVIIENALDGDETKIKEEFEKINLELGSVPQNIKISLSIGIARGHSLDSSDTLFKKADIAMYHSKKAGRGTVSIYDESMKRN